MIFFFCLVRRSLDIFFGRCLRGGGRGFVVGRELKKVEVYFIVEERGRK